MDLPKTGSEVLPLVEKKPQRVLEQDLNSFELWTVDRSDPSFKGKWLGISYKIVKISEVNDASNTFEAEFFLYPTWQEPSLVGKEKGMKFTCDKLPWEPKLKFKNELKTEIVAENYWLQDPATGTIDSSLRIRGTFYEHLELQNFPFDRQDLRLFVDSFYHKDNMRFYQRDDRPNSFAANRFPLAEWQFEEDTFEFRINKVGSGNSYINYIINCPVRRYHEYYMQNTTLTSFMLLAMGAGSFFFDMSAIDNRLNFIVTLALTAVAFKYLMTDRLPKVPYSTLFDKYMYSVFFIITFLAVDQIIVGVIPDKDTAKTFNIISFYVYAAVSVLLHLLVITLTIFRHRFIRPTQNR